MYSGAVATIGEPSGRAGEFGSEMQNTLVPVVTYRGGELEAYGRSIPKDEVGGDLVDLVAGAGEVTAYVADVCGHGLRAGVLMGMIKTAVRYGLLLRQPVARLLNDINRVLPGVKAPNMFATFAALRFDGSSEAEYISAGHVPLLHYRKRTGEVVRYAMSQFPLGLWGDAGYLTRRIRLESGDVFALVTDGVVETGEERDLDGGFKRLAEILRDLARRPLAEIAEAVYAELARHGSREDDQTVLLVRTIPAGREALEATWRKQLDELAAELAREEAEACGEA